MHIVIVERKNANVNLDFLVQTARVIFVVILDVKMEENAPLDISVEILE
jgi:hypothetical protein